MIRFFITLALLGAFVWFGVTVNLGKHTLFGHVGRIWSSEEATDLKEGVEERARPAVEKGKRVGKAAFDEANKPDAGRTGKTPRKAKD